MAPTHMLAAKYVPGNDTLVLDSAYPIRDLQDNEILLKVAAAGVCHSDVLYLSGVTLDTRTFVMGHETCGIPIKSVCHWYADLALAVAKELHRLGSKVNPTIKEGKLYSVLLLDSCMHGTKGGPASANGLGLGRDGSFAEYMITTADTLVPVPDGVPPEVAAIASDAGVTAYHAVEHAAKVKHGDKVHLIPL
ncbi:chaperonin 10-like protein [Mycena vitilis]|nr:chaperonin 10-like protein [Mycena vitilis]